MGHTASVSKSLSGGEGDGHMHSTGLRGRPGRAPQGAGQSVSAWLPVAGAHKAVTHCCLLR